MKIIKQNDIKDCGISVIQAMYKYHYDKWIDENELKIKANYGDKGLNLKNLVKLALDFNLEFKPYEATFESIKNINKKEFYIGLIESSGMNHYVIFKIVKNSVIVYDSINGKEKYTIFEFKKIFLNVVLTVDEIYEKKYQKIDFKSPFEYLSKNKYVLITICVSIMISIVFMFLSSLFMKIVIDKIIPNKIVENLLKVIIFFSFLYFLRIFNGFLKTYFLKKVNMRIKNDVTYMYINKMFNTSNHDLNKVTEDDHLRRLGLIEDVSLFLSSSFLLVFNQTLVLVISMSLLIWVSTKLFVIVLASTLISAIFTIIFKYLIKSKYDNLVQNQLNLFGNFIEIVNNKEKCKSPNYQKFIKSRINKNYLKNKSNNWSIWKISTSQNIIETLINYIIPLFITFVASKMIFNNEMTLGTLLMFLSLYNYFSDPFNSILDFFIDLPINLKNLKMVSFILNLEDSKLNPKGLKPKKIKSIKFKNYKVSKDKEIVNIKKLTIDKNIIITGKNGSGKTTFLKSLNLFENIDGEMKINNIGYEYYSIKELRKKIIYISSQNHFPNITIFDYITLGDIDAIKLFKSNLIKYSLFKILKEIDIDLNWKMENNASNLSDGQKQIINLLRLFAFDFELVLLDEAFENIDDKNYKFLGMVIKKHLKALIIEVSHSKKYITLGKEVNIEKS